MEQTTKEITLSEIICGCNTCKKQFTPFGLTGEQGNYGIFIMYAKNGDMALWLSVFDPIWDELSHLVKTSPLLATAGEGYRSSKFLSICGICCDRAPDGSVYCLDLICPYCASEDITHLREPEKVWKSFNMPKVTHNSWNKLDRKGKQRLVKDALSKQLGKQT